MHSNYARNMRHFIDGKCPSNRGKSRHPSRADVRKRARLISADRNQRRVFNVSAQCVLEKGPGRATHTHSVAKRNHLKCSAYASRKPEVGNLTLKRNVCSLVSHTHHVNLRVWGGARLKDPHWLVTGTGKDLRHIKVAIEAEVDSKYIAELVQQAAHLEDT